MHIPDGFVSPILTIPAYVAATPLWSFAVRRHFGSRAASALPVMGALTAMAFALQMIAIPVPGGTSTHVLGSTLIALVFHPWVAFVCESLVLVIQALFFATGGVTTLAINALALGVCAPFVCWMAYRLFQRFGTSLAAFVGAYLGVLAASSFVALVLGLQHELAPEVFPFDWHVSTAALLAPSLIVTGVVEGAYTVFALSVLKRAQARAFA